MAMREDHVPRQRNEQESQRGAKRRREQELWFAEAIHKAAEENARDAGEQHHEPEVHADDVIAKPSVLNCNK